MQKSKNATIIIIFFILIYSIIASMKLIIDFNTTYLYVINPIFWILMAIFLKITLGKQLETRKLKRTIIEYCLIAGLIYIISYMISGLFVTFGKNPYVTTPIGVIINLWTFGTIIVAKEYIRYKLINNVYEKDKIFIAIFISFVYIIFDIEINRLFFNVITPLYVTKIIAQSLIPLIGKNLLYSYTAMNSDYIPAILYEFITKLYIWISPILPNSPWVITSIIETVIPVILFLYIRYTKNKNDMFKSKEQLMRLDPKNIIPLVIIIILALWFAVGVFPIKPVAIATGSMIPEIDVGDVAIIKKCNANDVIVNDIIEYQMEGYTVIHRVIEKRQSKGEYTFITKGDNNNAADINPVTEDQIIGKCVFQIKYIGYPAVWLHIVQANEQVKVETGK